jgi:hypothetical protein
MKKLSILLILISIFGCAQRVDSSNKISSPGGKYFISASINHSKADLRKYLCLKLELFDDKGDSIGSEQTGVSDNMKWALGWMKDSDTVVLYSSDRGTIAYSVAADGAFKSAQVTPEIRERAEELKKEKYK